MFPTAPTMICRRCGQSFEFVEGNKCGTKSILRFECPFCKFETVGSGLYAFTKFYPRLVESELRLAIEGIKLVNYGIGNMMGLGVFNWLKEDMQFKCAGCEQSWLVSFDPDTLHYKEKPNLFFCPSCLKKFSPSATKEFFMSLNQTFEGAMKFTHVQWDIFSPIGLEVPVKNIQSKIFSEKFPI